MFFLKVRPKKQKAKLDKKAKQEITGIVGQELAPYLKREELQAYLVAIEKDEKRKRLWASLSPYKKIRVLKYVLEHKGGQIGKK